MIDIKLDDELDSLFDEASEVCGTSETSDKKTVAKTNETITFVINENDDEFKASLKNLINNSGITTQDIYDIKSQNNGYNMIYSLRKKGQLGIDRIKAWCNILHKKPVLTFVDMTEEEAKQVDEELLNELKNPTKKNKKK
jgi:hypothetical protein